MPDYEFLNLSPAEFEELSRDILQKEWGETLESFTSGRDDGIDLRYTTSPSTSLIVQCKRYSNFRQLFSNLKKEVAKVHTLSPSKYFLVTNLGLTPGQKGKIFNLFSPYIKKTGHIYGKNDLNNLLGKFPEIESQHFKLWLSSTNVLQKILNGKIFNQSRFEKDEIVKTVRIYVENDTYHKALKIIKKNNFVIISGIPGIGKTTLARILVYHFLAGGYEEFVFLSDSINEGFNLYHDSKKQVFFFDDFLGSNFLENKLTNNEEKRLAKFIERIGSAKNKILIFTTREYILAQAKQKFEYFDDKFLEFAKCTIDLSEYTKLIRAKILYNHLSFSDLPHDYINNILSNKNYFRIIQHPNYNPRIIETLTKNVFWAHIAPNKFSEKIVESLDSPNSIWEHVYENQISRFSQCLLSLLASTGTPIFLEDARNMIQNFIISHSQKYGFAFSEMDFKKSIKELENSFIRTNKDYNKKILIEFQNPSVRDFLIAYLRHSPDFLQDIISSAVFFNQLVQILSFRQHKYPDKNKISLSSGLRDLVVLKLLREFDSLDSINVKRSYRLNDSWYTESNDPYSVYEKLHIIQSEIPLKDYSELSQMVTDKFLESLFPTNLSPKDFNPYLELLNQFKKHYSRSGDLIIKRFANHLASVDNLQLFAELEYIFPDEYVDFVRSDEEFREKIQDFVLEEITDADADNAEDVLERLIFVQDRYHMDLDLELSLVRDIVQNSKVESEKSDEDLDYSTDSTGTDDKIIDDIFESLRDNDRSKK